MNTETIRVQQLLSIVNPSTMQVGGNENIEPSINTKLTLIGGVTRKAIYKYATITSNGAIHMHALIPMRFNDPTERNPQFKFKTVWVSVNLDPNTSVNEVTNTVVHYNSNYGILRHFLKSSIKEGDKVTSNPFNTLTLNDAKIRQALIPSNIDELSDETLKAINLPAIRLEALSKENIEIASGDHAKLKELNTVTYKEYLTEVSNLHQKGLLSLSTIFITPKQNSIDMSLSLDENINAISNPWLNANTYLNNQENIPLSSLPSHSTFTGLVQITDSDMSALLSDNTSMFGERSIFTDPNTGISRISLSKVGVIKDFGINVEVLVSITDTMNNLSNTNKTPMRSRVETFKSLLESNNNTFYIKGNLRPVVRTVNDNASRKGNVIFELVVDTYSVHKSTSLSSSIEVDSFSELEGFDIDTLSLSVQDTNTVEKEIDINEMI